MTVGVKTTEIVQYRFPTTVLLMLFHVVVRSHLEYTALQLFQINSTLIDLKEYTSFKSIQLWCFQWRNR